MHTSQNKPDRANRRQPLGYRQPLGNADVSGLTAAVAHPGRSLHRSRRYEIYAIHLCSRAAGGLLT